MSILNVDKKKLIIPGIIVLLMIVLAVFPTFGSSYRVLWLSGILGYVILSVAWALFSGSTGYISLATAAFYGVGMYTSAVLGNDYPILVVVVIGGIFSMILAAIAGAITLRLRGIYFAIFTFGMVELIKYILLWYEVKFTGTRGRFVVVVDNETIFYVVLGILAILLITTMVIRRSRWGLALQSIGDHEEAAAHTGINVTALKIIIFAISAFFMGAVGSIMAMQVTYIDPYSSFDKILNFIPPLMAIFGGIGTYYGPIIGAFVFATLEEYLVTEHADLYRLIIGLTLLAAILYMPKGIVGLVEKIWRRISGGKRAYS